jgi:hypothetical protein
MQAGAAYNDMAPASSSDDRRLVFLMHRNCLVYRVIERKVAIMQDATDIAKLLEQLGAMGDQ